MTTFLTTKLPPAECERRLRENVGGFLSMKDVRGSVRSNGASLRKSILYRNSFQTILDVDWEASGAGARITCEARMAVIVIPFLVVWFGAVVIACIFTLSALFGRSATVSETPFLLIPFGMLAAGIGMVAFGRHLARGEEEFLLDFLRRTLEAH